MDSLLHFILLLQLMITGFAGYQYYIYTKQCKLFRKNYFNFVKIVLGTSVGISFIGDTFYYLNNRLPRKFKYYINTVLEENLLNKEVFKKDFDGIEGVSSEELDKLKGDISDLKCIIQQLQSYKNCAK